MAATLANCKHPLQKDAGFLKVLQITRKCANFEARGMTAEKDMDGTKLKPLAGRGPTLKAGNNESKAPFFLELGVDTCEWDECNELSNKTSIFSPSWT